MKPYVLAAIERERQRQKDKWGNALMRVENPATSNNWKGNVLGEEMGEVNKAVVENDIEALKTELVHLAAVSIAWLESLG